MLRTSTKPNRCKYCGKRMPEEFARYVIHDACIAPWLDQQATDKARKREVDRRAAAKVERAIDKKQREAILTPAKRRARTEKAVNEAVRVRDHAQPCISCGTHTGVMHAGHYRSVKAAPHLRFDARNIHKQCAQCNLFESGNLIRYRQGFVARYGVEAVEAVECDNTPRHYSMDDLDVIRLDAITLTKQLKRELG